MGRRKYEAEALQLREYLVNREAQGELPIARGMLNRKTVSADLSIPYHALVMVPYLDEIVQHFNQRLREQGYKGSKWDLHAEKLKQWLERTIRDGSIPIHHGQINRAAVCDALDFPLSNFVRYPDFKIILQEYDEKVQKLELEKSKYDKLAPRLNEILDKFRIGEESPPLYRDKLNQLEISRKLDTNISALRDVESLRDQINEFDSWLSRTDLDVDGSNIVSIHKKFAPYVEQHGRRYEFSSLAGAVNEEFLIRLSESFCQTVGGKAYGTGKTRYLSLIRLLTWIVRNHPDSLESLASPKDEEIIDADDFESACVEWRDQLVAGAGDNGRTDLSTTQIIKAANVTLRSLADAAILPRICTLKPIKNARSKSRPRKSVAELHSNVAAVIAGALERGAVERGLEINTKDREDFVVSLNQALSNRSDLPDDLPEAIRVINRERLEALRRCAEREFQKWVKHHEEGQDLLSEDPAQILISLNDVPKGGTPVEQRLASARAALRTRGQAAGLSLYLRAIDDAWGGLVPRGNSPGIQSEYGQSIAKLHQKLGGYQRLEAYLNPHPHAITAGAVMYLVDTGANVSTARTLNLDCLSRSDQAGCMRVSGFKVRGGGKAIIEDLPVKDPGREVTTVFALKKLAEMTERYRRAAPPKCQNQLLLIRPQSNVTELSEHRFTAYFKQLVQECQELHGLKVLPSMIRPSVLLDIVLSKQGHLLTAQAKGRHDNADTTRGYTLKYPTRIIYEEKIRRFQDIFQAGVIANMNGVAERLNIDLNQLERLVETARRTGLGTVCTLPEAGIQPGTESGKMCTMINACVECKAQVVVASLENISDMLVWNASLHKAQPEWEAMRPERWEKEWLPWLAFTEVVIEDGLRGPSAHIFVEAKRLAKERSADPSFKAPEPW